MIQLQIKLSGVEGTRYLYCLAKDFVVSIDRAKDEGWNKIEDVQLCDEYGRLLDECGNIVSGK